MYDAVSVDHIPANPPAVAGYVAGDFTNFGELVSRFPRAYHVSIAIHNGERARALDIEPGDANPPDAPSWFHNDADHSLGKPIFYASASSVQEVINILSSSGIPRNQYYIWSAHYTNHSHICAPNVCGYPVADLTQWTQSANDTTLDVSECQSYVFVVPTPPRRNPTGTANFEGSLNTQSGRWEIRGTTGDFKAGTNGGKSAAYITFDETNGQWAIQSRPWARKPRVALDSEVTRAKPSGTAGFAGSFNANNGHWSIRGSSGDFQPGTDGGVAAAYMTFDESNGSWTIAGKPWKRSPLKAIAHFLGFN